MGNKIEVCYEKFALKDLTHAVTITPKGSYTIISQEGRQEALSWNRDHLNKY